MSSRVVIQWLMIAMCMEPAAAAELHGRITDTAGKAVSGAFVTAHAPERRMATSVVSDEDGRYRVRDLFPETYALSVTRIGYGRAEVEDFVLSPNGGSRDFELAAADSTDQLPGHAWLADLPDGAFKARFVAGCTICHDLGAKAIRGRRRSKEEWVAVINTMMKPDLDVYGVIPAFDPEELATWLIDNEFGLRPAHLAPADPARDASAPTTITHYDVGTTDTWAHDMAVEPATGAAWVVDYPFDELIRVDPMTGGQQRFKLPVRGAGMHTTHFDRSGKLWITLQLRDMVASFDPRTATFELYPGFREGSLIHSFAYDEHGLIELDAQGRMWLSEFGTNSVASFNPESGEIKEYDLRGQTGHTYGIALDSRGRVWYTKYVENIFGMFDPETGEIVEREMPRPDSAPHRMSIDDQDRLWIPNSGYSTLARYDIASDTLEEFPLPDKDVFPYATRFDGATGTVWVQGNGANSLYRFEPASATFESFRMPLPISYGRMIAIDYISGAVWTSLANYPNKHTQRTHGSLVRFTGIAPPRR